MNGSVIENAMHRHPKLNKDMKRQSQVVLFTTHFVNGFVIEQIQSLQKMLSSNMYEIFFLYNHEYKNTSKLLIPEHINLYEIDISEIWNYGYLPIYRTLFPGSCHYAVINFYKKYPNFCYYWFGEYDVYFTGNWSLLMDDCSENLGDYDFLSCHVETYDPKRNADWSWWYRHNDVGYPLSQCVKGFNPICRYSNRALSYIDRYQKEGHSAHSEVMITTCLHNAGFKIGDLGGTGEFTPDGWRNKYYVQGIGVNNGTMRWRPEFSREEIEALGTRNKLFHPLKG